MWTKVSDRLPKLHVSVLVSAHGTGQPYVSYLVDDSDYGTCWCDWEDYRTVEDSDIWMKLPKLPT